MQCCQTVGLFSVGVVALTHQPKTVACDNWNCNDRFYVNVRLNPIMFLQQPPKTYVLCYFVSTVIMVYHLETQIG